MKRYSLSGMEAVRQRTKTRSFQSWMEFSPGQESNGADNGHPELKLIDAAPTAPSTPMTVTRGSVLGAAADPLLRSRPPAGTYPVEHPRTRTAVSGSLQSIHETLTFQESRGAVNQAFSRFVRNGLIERVSGGVFVRPRKSHFVGAVLLDVAEVVRTKAPKGICASASIPLLSSPWGASLLAPASASAGWWMRNQDAPPPNIQKVYDFTLETMSDPLEKSAAT